MNSTIVHETFSGPEIDSRLKWLYPPAKWSLEGSALVVRPDAGTDFWQRTHYGFQADNGHFLYLEVEGDWELSTDVRFLPANQYDQAGLMVRISPDCWLKTSVEFEPEGANRLGAVVTNGGYSDWSTQDYPKERTRIALRVRREGADYIVEHAAGCDGERTAWTQMRVAHLHEDRPGASVWCGLYACSPRGAGLTAAFSLLDIVQSGS